jgi:threonine dehydratase
MCGCDTFFKLENLQMTGSFKERGALNKLESLTAAEKQQGVIAASAGNHAQAVAYHAKRMGISAKVIMPKGQIGVSITIETKNRQHINQITKLLRKRGYWLPPLEEITT